MNIENENSLNRNAKLGSSWEGFALECDFRSLYMPEEQIYFWGTHAGAELDLFWQHDGNNWGCEFKYADAPKLTRSIKSALDSLGLKTLWIIYPGKTTYKLHPQIIVLSLQEIGTHWIYTST